MLLDLGTDMASIPQSLDPHGYHLSRVQDPGRPPGNDKTIVFVLFLEIGKKNSNESKP